MVGDGGDFVSYADKYIEPSSRTLGVEFDVGYRLTGADGGDSASLPSGNDEPSRGDGGGGGGKDCGHHLFDRLADRV